MKRSSVTEKMSNKTNKKAGNASNASKGSSAKFEKFSNPNKYDVTWVNRNFGSEKNV
jgi:hypothetical protein